MKKTKNLLATICFAILVSVGFANTKPELKKSESIQIQNYLEKLEFNKLIKKQTKIEINFIINQASEIVVVSTNSPELDEFIKSGLNYKTIYVSDLLYNKEYTLPVNVVLKN
jgi:hypothetical protein